MLLVVLLQLLGLQVAVWAITYKNQFKWPPGFNQPTGYTLIYELEGIGTQNYICAKNSGQGASSLSWTLYEVAAKLHDLTPISIPDLQVYKGGKKHPNSDDNGAVVGTHFLYHTKDNHLTPIWEIRRKRIYGQKVATAAIDANNIPWLELKASGDSNVKKIYRTNTVGGVVPSTRPCRHEGRTAKISYSAVYSFWG